MCIFTTVIQDSSRSPSYRNQRRKRNKRNPDWKRKVKLSLFADDMILYTENPKDSMRKLLEKVMTNLDSIFKSRDITLPTKVRLIKAMVFPVVMYGCESWTV